MITPEYSQKQIQAEIDAGGVVEFGPGIYESAHYRITKPVHLIGNGAVLVGGKRVKWTRVRNTFSKEPEFLLCSDAPGKQPLRSLVVNGQLRKRCRLPEPGRG